MFAKLPSGCQKHQFFCKTTSGVSWLHVTSASASRFCTVCPGVSYEKYSLKSTKQPTPRKKLVSSSALPCSYAIAYENEIELIDTDYVGIPVGRDISWYWVIRPVMCWCGCTVGQWRWLVKNDYKQSTLDVGHERTAIWRDCRHQSPESDRTTCSLQILLVLLSCLPNRWAIWAAVCEQSGGVWAGKVTIEIEIRVRGRIGEVLGSAACDTCCRQ